MINDALKRELLRRVNNHESPKRTAFSSKYPAFKGPVIFLRCSLKQIQNRLDPGIQTKKSGGFYRCTIASHEAELRRNASDIDTRLQENKIFNIKNAVERLNGIVIENGKTFSFWNTVGKPSYKNGYVDGRIYTASKVIAGVGGGLCQLSTFLYWLFLHAPVDITERHPHSVDVNPNSRHNTAARAGATVLYNFMDLKVKADFEHPLQLKITLADSLLKGEILSAQKMPEKITVLEKNHCFIQKDGRVYQYNEIHKELSIDGRLLKAEKIAVNFTEVLYQLTDEYIAHNNFTVLKYGSLIGSTT